MTHSKIKEVRQCIVKFCARRERSPKETMDKLNTWDLPTWQVSEIMTELYQEGLVNEQRFANVFCHDKYEINLWGKEKIKAHIRIHQLSEEVVNAALSRIEPKAYFKRLQLLAQKKWDSLRKEDDKLKRKHKTFAFLASRGFEFELIQKAFCLMEYCFFVCLSIHSHC